MIVVIINPEAIASGFIIVSISYDLEKIPNTLLALRVARMFDSK